MARKTGRPPKPHHLKVIEGNPGKRPLVEPPKPPPSRPRCPDYLPTYAKTVWRRLVPILDEMGILTTADRETMAAYCVAVDRFRDAVIAYAKTGGLVKGQKGEAVTNPALRNLAAATRDIATFSAMFGLSPADRVRLIGQAGNPAGVPDLEDVLGL